MGRIVKRAVMRKGSMARLTNAKIDSGADTTLLAMKDAISLGFDPCVGKPAAVGGVGGRAVGREFTIDITVGTRKANVTAVVPMFQLIDMGEGKEPKIISATRKESLIGHDFLQTAGAKLDYSKPHEKVFSGVEWPEWTVRPATRAESRLLDKKLRCPRKPLKK